MTDATEVASGLDLDPDYMVKRVRWLQHDTCQHDSAHGLSGPYGNEWECDGCGYRWRDVPDPDGPCLSTRLGRFRKEPLPPADNETDG